MPRILLPLSLAGLLLLTVSCSMTKGIPEDDQLFVGLKPIAYPDNKNYAEEAFDEHLSTTKEEVEAALATVSNGSVFGSSYFTVPWSWRLSVYNRFAGKDNKFSRWVTKAFGRPPVLMSKVNPALRASVARTVLRNNGYLRGDVTYEILPQRNPKKAKIAYTVQLDTLMTFDAVDYVNFPAPMKALIDSTKDESLIQPGMPFSITALDGERNRVSTLMRNNGYYYFNAANTSYLADTFAVENKAKVRLQLASGLPESSLRKWYIGNIDVQFRKSMMEPLADSTRRNHLIIRYNGRRSPIRPSLVLRDMRLFPRQPYSYEKYQESASLLNSNGLFSTTDFLFTPRPDTDTLDLVLNCIFDKPYDFYIEGNAIGRTSGRYGPQARIGFTKRNAFRAGEKLDISLHGSYEFSQNGGASMNSYQYGVDAGLEFPRLLIPFYSSRPSARRYKNGRALPRRRFYTNPVTIAKVSADIIHRPEYYKMYTVSGEWTYRWQPTAQSHHEFSPIVLKYQFKSSITPALEQLMETNRYLQRTMSDYFIPKMHYTYTYTSPASYHSPIRWEITAEEAGNVISLIDAARGKSLSQAGKELLNTPYAQFLKLETHLTKTWAIGSASSLVGHLNAGYIYAYSNSINSELPFSEEFYVGGANSLRGFSMRSVGPGNFYQSQYDSKQSNFLMRNGNLKLVANLEYRAPLFGKLAGAFFIDAGNIWRTHLRDDVLALFDNMEIETSDGIIVTPDEVTTPDEELIQSLEEANEMIDQMEFKPSKFLNDIALCAGIGLRYDLGFLVVRLDWGFALHTPHDTGKSGYFNPGSFKDAQTLHLAIGYPF